MPQKEFVPGLYFQQAPQKAPDWVLGKSAIKRLELLQWLEQRTEEWINLDVLMGKKGKPYYAVNNWKKEESLEDEMSRRAEEQSEPKQSDDEPEVKIEDIPF